MKKIFSLILVFVLALSAFSACGEEEVCTHKGGIATCDSLAECSLCGVDYGSKNPENHSGTASWVTTQTTHKLSYGCCETVVVAEEAHEFYLGTCQECRYVCEHIGGEATCSAKAVCTNCGFYYGEKDHGAHTGESKWVSDASSHKLIYTCCYAEPVPKSDHNWRGGVCATCGYECLHAGGTATCQSMATCEICGTYYGKLDNSTHSKGASWIKTPTSHRKMYPCCSTIAVILNAQPHNFLNGVCVECNFTCEHNGGVATCINRAVCEYCGTAYGNKDPLNHVGTKEQVSDGVWTYTCCGQKSVG